MLLFSFRTVAAVAAVCTLLFASTVLTGCSTAEARRHAERTAAATEQVIDVKGSIDQVLQLLAEEKVDWSAAINAVKVQLEEDQRRQAESVMAIAEMFGLSVEDLLGQLDELANKAAADVAGGGTENARQRVAQGLVEISGFVGRTADTMLGELAQLQEELKDKQASEDATWAVVNTVLKIVAGVFLGGLPIGIFARRSGQKSGAETVAGIVSTGRRADPQLDNAFSSGAGHDAMKELLNRAPEPIRLAVKSAK